MSSPNEKNKGLTSNLTSPNAQSAVSNHITVEAQEPCIVIGKAPTLAEMLASFKPDKHGGEIAAWSSVGREAFAVTNATL